ncbi:unnamed protein product [Discosporangium mesarthrocarpum]
MPTVINIVRKPKGVGLEIKNGTGGQTRTLYSMEFVKKQEVEATKPFRHNYQAGTALVLRILAPLRGQPYHVCGDTAFAPVTSAAALKDEYGMYFTCIVKTAHKYFPVK